MYNISRDNSRMPKANGRNSFQASLIRRSYRYRGKVARDHTQKNTSEIIITCVKIDLNIIPVIKDEEIILKKKILPYSAIKIKANRPDPYSMLNPDTNSDSPSEKSNGVRLVSAIQEMTHNKAVNGRIRRMEINLEDFIISSIS